MTVPFHWLGVVERQTLSASVVISVYGEVRSGVSYGGKILADRRIYPEIICTRLCPYGYRGGLVRLSGIFLRLGLVRDGGASEARTKKPLPPRLTARAVRTVRYRESLEIAVLLY